MRPEFSSRAIVCRFCGKRIFFWEHWQHDSMEDIAHCPKPEPQEKVS